MMWLTFGLPKRVFIKLILNEDLKNSAAEYLESNGVIEEFVYPK